MKLSNSRLIVLRTGLKDENIKVALALFQYKWDKNPYVFEDIDEFISLYDEPPSRDIIDKLRAFDPLCWIEELKKNLTVDYESYDNVPPVELKYYKGEYKKQKTYYLNDILDIPI